MIVEPFFVFGRSFAQGLPTPFLRHFAQGV